MVSKIVYGSEKKKRYERTPLSEPDLDGRGESDL